LIVVRLPRSLLPIYGTNLVDTLGYSLLIPLLPLVVTQYGAPPIVAGALLSCSALVAMLVAPIWGIMSDRFGRKKMIVAAEAISCAANLLLALSHSIGLFFLSRVLAGLGTGGGGALDEAFIADVTKEDQRNLAYAMYGAVYGLGFIIGPSVAGAFAVRSFGGPFFVAAGLAAVNVVLSQLFIPDMQPSGRTRLWSSMSAVRTPRVQRLVLSHFFFIFAVVCFLANFGLYVHRVLHGSPSTASWALASAGAVGGFTLLAGVNPLAKRFGERRIALLGLGCSAAAYFLLLLVPRVAFEVVVALWAVGASMTLPTLTTLLSESTQKDELGAVMGTTDAIYGLAMMLGPVSGAAIIGSNAPLLGILPGCAAVIAAALVSNVRSSKDFGGQKAALP
jgi:DHA1 family tetracycline resistance protein-like MFS transporter